MDKSANSIDILRRRNSLGLIICFNFIVGECLTTDNKFKVLVKKDAGNENIDDSTIYNNRSINSNSSVNNDNDTMTNSNNNNNTIDNNTGTFGNDNSTKHNSVNNNSYDTSNNTTNGSNTTNNNNTVNNNSNNNTTNNTTNKNNNITTIRSPSINHTIGQATSFLVVFRIKTVWPIDKSVLEKDIAVAFNHVVLTQNFINVTIYIVNITCLWSCPRRKRAADNSTVIFNPTYGNGTTPRWTTATTIKYNDYNSAQGSVLESSAAQVVFAMFEGRVGERIPIDATIVSGIFRFYSSLNELNVQLHSVDEVLSFPIPLAEFLASTDPPPLPPNPITTLLIPPWAIFLLVFVGLLLLLFIIWIIYSCMTGTLKDGGAALLVEDYQDSHDHTDVGPLSHKYDINLHKAEVKSAPPPLVPTGPKPPRTIRFDRSTSYDVGLLSSNESDKMQNKDNYVPLYKRREFRVHEGAAKKMINKKKLDKYNSGLETSVPTYTPKFTRLNSTEKQLATPLPSIKQIPPSPNNSLRKHQGVGNDSNSSEHSDVNDHFLKTSGNKLQNVPNDSDDDKRKSVMKKRERVPDNASIKSGSYIADVPFVNPYLYPIPISPYPIFQPLQTTYPYPMPPIFPNHPHLNPNHVLMYSNQIPHTLYSNASLSPKPSQSLNGDSEETARTEKFRKMAKELVEEAFDDSGFSTTSFSNRNESIEKPTDMEEFRKVLDEAFAFSKQRPS